MDKPARRRQAAGMSELPLRGPDRLERFLAIAAMALLACVVIAIVRGHQDWSNVGANIWLHLVTIITALALTPVILLRRRGDRPHRALGWIWCLSLAATALISFDIRLGKTGGFSIIHLLSIWTLIQVPLIIWSARTHRPVQHRRAVRGMTIGALLVAGFFTFPFNRLLGHWLFG